MLLRRAQAQTWIELVLATPVVLWGGWPFFVACMDLARQSQPEHVHADRARCRHRLHVQRRRDSLSRHLPRFVSMARTAWSRLYFEAAAVITALVLLGQVLELSARSHTGAAINALLQPCSPKTARLVRTDGTEIDVPLEHVALGDSLRVRPGEKIPVDGVVTRWIEQRGRIDDHRRADPGRKTIRRARHRRDRERNGDLVMRAERVGRETLLAQIVRMVSEAQRSRAPVQKLADVVAGYFVPIVVGVAAITFWSGRCGAPLRAWRTRSSTPSPCSSLRALAPSASRLRCPSWSAPARAHSLGVLFKNAEAIEILEKVDTLVVDKTGTLTEGKPKLVVRRAVGRIGRDPAAASRRISRTRERTSAGSGHCQGSRRARNRTLRPTEAFESLTGTRRPRPRGQRQVALGNRKLLRRARRGPRRDLRRKRETMRADGQTVMFVVADETIDRTARRRRSD